MYSPIMNKYFKAGKQPVIEGWGKVASSIFIGLGPVLHGILSEKAAKKILADPKIKKYILSECDKLYNQVKKDGYSNNCDMQGFNVSRGSALSSGITFKNHLFNSLAFFEQLGKYWVAGVGDTDHIEKIIVFFMNKDKKFISKVIPAPTKDDLKALGFRKEDSFN